MPYYQLFGGSLGGGNASGLASLLGGAGGPRVRQVSTFNQYLSFEHVVSFAVVSISMLHIDSVCSFVSVN